MGDWLANTAGTPLGGQIALVLALMSALLHAVFGALQKGRFDPWLTRGAIDFSYGMIAVFLVLFVVPVPAPHMWPIFAITFVIHAAYKLLQAKAYAAGAFTVVYPVVRGTGPLVTVVAAGVLFQEHFTPAQWLGVFMLVSGIFGLAGYNLSRVGVDRKALKTALFLAVLSGLAVATYTTFDAYGIRQSLDPFSFLAWFFMLEGLVLMPTIAVIRWRRMDNPPAIAPLMRRGLIGGIVAYFSFGGIILATYLGSVGEAAVMRETSSVFAGIIGWIVLKEQVGWRRLALMGLIAAGAVIVELGAA